MEMREDAIERRASDMAKCRGCGAEIRWIETSAGKRMPCDPELTPYWEKPGAAGKVVTPNGEVISCEFSGEASKVTGLGYVPHWGTCPAAGRFKKGKGGGESE